MAVTPDQSGPYAPASIIVELIDRHRNKGLPSPVNGDVLERAGVSASLIARTLQALVVLDLIDAEGKPTAALEGMRLAPAADYKTRMGEWLTNAYADALLFVDPATADEEAVRDAFRKYNPVGQQGRMVSLFMALFRHAGIAPEKTPTGGAARKKPQAGAAPKARVEKPRVEPATKPAGMGAGIADKPKEEPKADYMSALLAKFPDFDPAWPDDIKAKWFEGFEQFMKGAAPK